ncbi:MAG: cbb3-type cytochrome oxidase assembly protein CcoS [Hyphomonadaceae bacterium]
MDLLIFLAPAALLMGFAGLAAFLWSLKAGQYDDMEGAAHRILIDED